MNEVARGCRVGQLSCWFPTTTIESGYKLINSCWPIVFPMSVSRVCSANYNSTYMDTGVLNRLWKKSNIYGGGFRANTIADKSHPTWLLFISWNAANDGVTGIIEMIGIRSGIRLVGSARQRRNTIREFAVESELDRIGIYFYWQWMAKGVSHYFWLRFVYCCATLTRRTKEIHSPLFAAV